MRLRDSISNDSCASGGMNHVDRPHIPLYHLLYIYIARTTTTKSKLDPATQSDLDHSASLVFMYILLPTSCLIIPPLESLFPPPDSHRPCWYWPCKVAPYQNVLPAIHPRLDLYSDDDPSTTTSLSSLSYKSLFRLLLSSQQQQRTAAPIFLSIADETSRLMSIRPTSVFCVSTFSRHIHQ